MSGLYFSCRFRYASGFELSAEFSAADGVTALFGPSGSGKSTVLNLIAGLLRPHGGVIRIDGVTVADCARGMHWPAEARHVGFVFQDHLLFPHLSVEANLRYGQRRREAKGIDLGRVAEVLDLADLLDRAPATLSGGQRQRVALGRALLSGPRLLLMDEPLAGIDDGLKERILGYLERAIEEWHIPTLYVSHDQADVRRLGEQVVVLEAGRVVEVGPVGSTLDRAVLTRMTHRPGPVNLLRVDRVRDVAGRREGRIGDQTVQLPPTFVGARDVAYVQFLPSEVTLSRSDVAGLSTRNHLTGTVSELVELPGRVFVAVDVGRLLWAEVTPEAARELGLGAGTLVTCLIKTSALQAVL